MRRLIVAITTLVLAIPVYASETGLFTYEGGFFIKNGAVWQEYRPKEKPGIWATYTQYNEEDKYYNIRNNNCVLSIPKTSNNNFYVYLNGDWKVIYITRVIYPYYTDSSVGLFCFTNGYYVRDGKKWRLYLPDKSSSVWASFEQYDENDKFFFLKNNTDKVCVPKRADLKCFIWDKNNNKWLANYSITEIYDCV